MRPTQAPWNARWLAAAALAALLPLAGLPVGEAKGDDDRSRILNTEGVCDLVGGFLPVPEARVRALLPPSYEPAVTAGQGQATVIAAYCYDQTINGNPVADMHYALISVEISQPKGSYDLWETSSSKSFQQAMKYLGKASNYSKDVAFEADPDAPVPTARMSAPGPDGGFELQATFSRSEIPRTHTTSDHYNYGQRGPVEAHHHNNSTAVGPAIVSVKTRAGSAAAILLGATSVRMPGLWLEFEVTATYTTTLAK